MELGENANIPYPQCGRKTKIPLFKQQRVPNTGQKMGKEGENWGKIGEKLFPARLVR